MTDLDQLEALARAATPEHFRDEIDAVHAANEWFESIIDTIPKDERMTLEFTRYGLTLESGATPNGGVQTLWHQDRIIAQAVLVRTTGNSTALIRHHSATILALIAKFRTQQQEIASLRLTLGGRTFSATVPEPVGCPLPGACAQVAEIARLRDENAALIERVRVAEGRPTLTITHSESRPFVFDED